MAFDLGLTSMAVFLGMFTGTALFGYFLTVRGNPDERKARDRLRGIAQSSAGPERESLSSWALAKLLKLGRLASATKEGQGLLRKMLLQAGYFHANGPQVFTGARLALTLIAAVVGVVACLWIGPDRGAYPSLVGVACCAVGFLAPGLWLSARVAKRQRLLRGALPDALDMMVLGLEGGISFAAAIQRVTDELQVIHPALGMEMDIFQREVQLGLSAGEAFQKLADRCGLPDVRDLAIVLIQSERYGASVTKALRNYAETAREDRQQKAEEMAQKAAVKIIFPTLLCIFPAIFIVILGPAAFQLAELFPR